MRRKPVRRTTPSGARSSQSSATRSSRLVRPEPAGPVRRTERPRASRRTSCSRSSWRPRSGCAGRAGPAGAGGRAARSASARCSGVRLTGRSGSSVGGQSSISLPSTGLTVSRCSPATSRTVRAMAGVCWPKSVMRGSLDGRGVVPPPVSNSLDREVPAPSWPYSSGPRVFGSIGSSPPKASCGGSPSRPRCTLRCRFWSGARSRAEGGGQTNRKPSHSIYDSPGYRAARSVTVS